MKLAIGVPCPDRIPIEFASNLVDIMFTTAKFPKIEKLVFVHATGVRTDKNRNKILDDVLKQDFTHILWLDADMVFPNDIVYTYMNADPTLDIMGCLYFKRSEPYDPIAYIYNPDESSLRPYMSLDPSKLPENTVVEVDGLGFGGVLVNLDVYRELGDDKWMVYGRNFHLPFDTTDKETHDLNFFKKAKDKGFKVLLHTGVKPTHLATVQIGEEDWKRANGK